MIGTKPGKLRAACNQCAASKIKCSGEKTGCSSCENRKIKCVFAQSRVGRVPGLRGKKKPAQDDTRTMINIESTVMGGTVNAAPASFSPLTPEDLQPLEMEYISSSTPGSQVPDKDLELFDEDLLHWSNVSNCGLDDTYQFDDNNTKHIFDALQGTPPDLPQQQELSPVGQVLHNVASHSSWPPRASNLSPPETEPGCQTPLTNDVQFSSWRSASTTSPYITAAISDRNNQCVITCSQIIFNLEKYQADKLKVLDIILGIIKGVTKRIEPLVNGQFEHPNTKCLSLFDVILYQLVEILEDGCADFLTESMDGQRPPSMDLLEPGLHEFDLYGFGIGFKDQERFRSQMILNVLRPLMQIMKKVLFISTSAGLDRANSHQEGHSRLKALEEKVKNRARSVVIQERNDSRTT